MSLKGLMDRLSYFCFSFDYLEWQLHPPLIVPGVGPEGAVSQESGWLQQAYSLGREMAG